MKGFLVAAATVTCLSGFAQGLVVFNNRAGGVTHVYAPYPGDYRQIVGNGSNDRPAGSTDYLGSLPIGTTGSLPQYGAATTLAQLLGAPGQSAPESTLIPAINLPSSFRTGAAAGSVASSVATFNNILPDAPIATFQMVAWDNSSGLYPTWTEASIAWMADLIAAGKSPLFTLNQIGGGVNFPQGLFNDQNGAPGGGGVQSFNLYFVPEPATAVLAGLSAAALLIVRRQKFTYLTPCRHRLMGPKQGNKIKHKKMKTKTLLVTAALAAAVATSSWAQSNGYSLNVVGYYNVTAGANQQVLLGNQLDTTNDTLAGVIPNPPPLSLFYKYANGGFTTYQFDDVDLVWVPNGNASLKPGQGGFFKSPVATTLTFVGEVMQGRLTNSIAPGQKNFICSIVPQAGRVTSDLGLPADPLDILYLYQNGGFTTYQFDDVDLVWVPTEPVVAVGQAFVFIGQRDWVRNFTVQ
jgi:hypothetical protein